MSKFAFVFPGQGSQSIGMLEGWGDHPVVREVLREASDALSEDIGKLIREGTKEELALTTNTQPIMLVAGVAAYRVWIHEVGQKPAIVAGHSLGEYSALVAAEALTLSEAAPLVRFRATAMQEATPVGFGAMAAILGMSSQEIQKICNQVTQSFSASDGELVEAANFNDLMQTVIAGTKVAVEKACVALKTAGAKRALLLEVSAPFHTSLMLPAAEKLKTKLAEIKVLQPQIPCLNNVDVRIEEDAEKIKEALYRQAFSAVRWVEIIQKIQSLGIHSIIECGPGKVLAGMNKRINSELLTNTIFDSVSLRETKLWLQSAGG